MKLTKTPILVFVAIVDRPPESKMQSIVPIAQFGFESEKRWIVSTKLFTCPKHAETYRADVQRRLDAEMNKHGEDSTSRYEALMAGFTTDIDVAGPL